MSEKILRGIKSILRLLLETALLAFILIGIPFLLSGTWPPFVSVVSNSMAPTFVKGDMIFVVDTDRFSSSSDIHGISTDSMENKSGDVIVYQPNGNSSKVPVIHRAMMHVDKGENWVSKADDDYTNLQSCNGVNNCPAPNAGFITKGDSNDVYDQAAGISRPVKASWINSKAEQKIPILGWIRVALS